ncbi:hypothetical protein SAMN06297251_12822 [Fulvimarina manganoxydans]|uniref:ABC transporter n=1 Tax=Fulvimarina manganoxydans TaxID=937218 RepID=A0A1W2EMK0_9HYPH|nr:hypothetical protein SAMN06297251_12822 [Fulvimarina manganoxydans]
MASAAQRTGVAGYANCGAEANPALRLTSGHPVGAGQDIMLLDEPTNHLDIATKQMLVEALSRFEGAMLFVGHDRHFLSALSNRVLELTPEGPHLYGGGYREYVDHTGQEAPGLRS